MRSTGSPTALIVDTTELGTDGRLVLFVVADGRQRPGGRVTEAIRARVRAELSPRHVPDRIEFVPSLPRTLNGKKLEVPARRILLGTDPAVAVTPGAVDDREALERFTDLLVSLRERA